MLEVERYDEIWRSDGLQKDWVLEIERDGRSPEGLKAAIVTPHGKQAIGFVCPESIEAYQLDQRGAIGFIDCIADDRSDSAVENSA